MYRDHFDHLGQPLPSNEPWQIQDLIVITASVIASTIFISLLITGA